MKKCFYCGAQMNDDSLFCTKCGKPIPQGSVCPHCGALINTGDAFCQNCGASMSVSPVPVSQQMEQTYFNQPVSGSNRSSNGMAIALSIIGVFVFAVLCAGGWWYYTYEYAPKQEAKQARIQAEQAKAKAIQVRDSLDQVLWQKTLEKNDEEAYRLYLEKYPNGKHADQAQLRVEREEMLKLTDDEEYSVSNTINSFFSYLANEYEDGLLSNVNPSLSSFLGKKNATKVDVIAYMKKIHSDDIFSVQIMMGDITVKKSLDSEQNPVYTATFTYDQRLEREDTSLETFASLKGTATLNSNYKITSLSLSKTASY